MRLTQRRKLVRKAADKGIDILKERVQGALSKWWRSLYKKLQTIKKADDANVNNDDAWWQQQMDDFANELTDAMVEAATLVGKAEVDFWKTRGHEVGFDYMDIVKAYQNRIGRKITRIGEDTRADTAAKITEWYSTDAGLPDLVDQLKAEFGERRAELIAQTEMTGLTSQFTFELMGQLDQTDWTWEDVEDNFVCPLCSDLHGTRFTKDDPMPPDASHPGCRCAAAIADY